MAKILKIVTYILAIVQTIILIHIVVFLPNDWFSIFTKIVCFGIAFNNYYMAYDILNNKYEY